MGELAVVQSNYSRTWVQNGIIYQEIDPKVVKISLEIAKQLVQDRVEATGNSDVPMPVMVTVNNAINVSSDAKEFYAKDESYKQLSAIAMLMDNYIARMIGNLVFRLNKQPTPTQFFNDRRKALHWLETFKYPELN